MTGHHRPPLIVSTVEVRKRGYALGRVRWVPSGSGRKNAGDWIPDPDGPLTIWIYRAAAFALPDLDPTG